MATVWCMVGKCATSEDGKRRGGKGKADRYERNHISHVHSHESVAISLFKNIAREQLPAHFGGRSRNKLYDDHVSLHEGAGIRGVLSYRRLVPIETQYLPINILILSLSQLCVTFLQNTPSACSNAHKTNILQITEPLLAMRSPTLGTSNEGDRGLDTIEMGRSAHDLNEDSRGTRSDSNFICESVQVSVEFPSCLDPLCDWSKETTNNIPENDLIIDRNKSSTPTATFNTSFLPAPCLP